MRAILTTFQKVFLGIVTLAGIIAFSLWFPHLFQSGVIENSGEIILILEAEFPHSNIHEDIYDPNTIVFVHNGESEQCKRGMRFIEDTIEKYPEYQMALYHIEQNGAEDYLTQVDILSGGTCWLDTSLTRNWLVYPTLFVGDKVFVGYGTMTKRAIKRILTAGE